MIEENGLDDCIITIHSGIGFDPIRILKDSLPLLNLKDKEYVKQIIRQFEKDEEIILLKLTKSSIT